ncbi:hypothetical protein [Thalassolituus oleivorans]|uniref:hypothetical protein n=1 Tax=Thalassolituus oleivorans TaxID=187493 RepID=UPI0023F4094B|nr:hypothetical protein [Thalassolituus oleivorans]
MVLFIQYIVNQRQNQLKAIQLRIHIQPSVPGVEQMFIIISLKVVAKFFFDELGFPWPKHDCEALLEIITEELELIERKRIFIRARRLRRKREREEIKREKN